MRKASQDGGDSTSITSGIESETKKPGAGILKSTKNSIKRKVQHFSDDTANEPLLHKNREISEIEKQSAKLLLSKTKTDFGCQKGDDKDKLLADDKIAMPSISDVTGLTHCGIIVALKKAELKCPNSQSTPTASIHNHMNTNVFGNMEGQKNSGVAKTQILIELDASKSTGYSPSPLIFTTAKIHTDGKMQQMEPVQVTPVPILSTIEGGVVKTETKIKGSSEKSRSGEFIEIKCKNDTERQSKDEKNGTVPPLTTQIASLSMLQEKREFNTTSTINIIGSASNKSAQNASNLISDNKAKDASTPKHVGSGVGNIKNIPDISKESKDEISSKKIPQLSQIHKTASNDSTGSKLSNSTIKQSELTKSSKNTQILNKSDIAHKISSSSSNADKSYVDINKNVQSDSQTDTGERETGSNKVDLKVVASKPLNDVRKTEELGKINPSPISTSKTSQGDHKSSAKSLNSEKSAIVTTAAVNNMNTVSKTKESGLSNTTSPSTSLASTKKTIDKTPLIIFSKRTSIETSPLVKPSSKKAAASDQSNVTKIVPIITPTITDTSIKIPQITPSSSSMVTKIQCTTESSKTTSSDPISNVKNTFTAEDKTKSNEIKGSNFGPANDQSATASTALKSKTTGNSIIKTTLVATPNNAATVVSSISKPTATASGIKPSFSTPSTGVVTSVPKQSVSTKMVSSGIPIGSSSDKPSTVNAANSDKVNATSSPINKSISNNTKPASETSKVNATDSSSIVSPLLSSTAKPSSTKPAAKNVFQTQDKPSKAVKEAKGSKA